MRINELVELNRKNGQHFFDPEALEFFKARVEPQIYGDRYFITSEKNGSLPRGWTIRQFDDQGHVTTVGKFQAYASLAQARKAAVKLAESLV